MGAPGALRPGLRRRRPTSRLGHRQSDRAAGNQLPGAGRRRRPGSSGPQQLRTMGRQGASPLGRPLGWAVRTDQLDQLAHRLNLTVRSGKRVTPSGELLRWRSAGIDQAAAEPSLPFFLEWAAGVRLPGTTAVAHPAAPVGIAKLLLEGDPDRLAAWLGNHVLPVVVRTGRPAVAAVVLSTATGKIVLGAEQP